MTETIGARLYAIACKNLSKVEEHVHRIIIQTLEEKASHGSFKMIIQLNDIEWSEDPDQDKKEYKSDHDYDSDEEYDDGYEENVHIMQLTRDDAIRSRIINRLIKRFEADEIRARYVKDSETLHMTLYDARCNAENVKLTV